MLLPLPLAAALLSSSLPSSLSAGSLRLPASLSTASAPLLPPLALSSRLSAAPRHRSPLLSAPLSASALLTSLFPSNAAISPDAIAAACAPDVVWDDLTAAAPATGVAAVRALLTEKWPAGAGITIVRLAEGETSAGFTWTRTELGTKEEEGLRGTLYAELDSDGRLCYVREGSEPQLKPGEATEALLKAVTASMDKEEKGEATFESKTPTTANGIATYLWKEAYPNGGEVRRELLLP